MTPHRPHLLDGAVSGPSQPPKSPGLAGGLGSSAKAITVQRRLRAEQGPWGREPNAWGPGPRPAGRRPPGQQDASLGGRALPSAGGRRGARLCGPRSPAEAPRGGFLRGKAHAISGWSAGLPSPCEHTKHKAQRETLNHPLRMAAMAAFLKMTVFRTTLGSQQNSKGNTDFFVCLLFTTRPPQTPTGPGGDTCHPLLLSGPHVTQPPP